MKKIGEKKVNFEYKGYRVNNVATKIGKAVGGTKGEKVGAAIDKSTPWLTIKVD